MKKRNLLLAVMAALTLSGCMLNQTEEKVYKTAEELPDDPVERYKAVSSLCKFNGVDSRLCLNYQIEVNVNKLGEANMYFLSRDPVSGEITYSRRLPYSEKLKGEVSLISKEGCDIHNIKKSCRNYGYLEGYHLTGFAGSHGIHVYPSPINLDKAKRIVTSEEKYSEFSYFNKACSLGDIESCAVVIRGIQGMTFLFNDMTYRINDIHTIQFFKKNYIKIFSESQNNFRKLYSTDPKALRFQKFRHDLLSKNFREASKKAYLYCIQYNDSAYCGIPENGISSLNFFLGDQFLYSKLLEQGNSFLYKWEWRDEFEMRFIDEFGYEFSHKLEFKEEEIRRMKALADFFWQNYRI